MTLTKEDIHAIAALIPEPQTDPMLLKALSEVQKDVALIRQMVEANQALAVEVDHRIRGNGKPGLETRIDRMEGHWKAVAFLIAPIYVSVIGIVVKLVWGS